MYSVLEIEDSEEDTIDSASDDDQTTDSEAESINMPDQFIQKRSTFQN